MNKTELIDAIAAKTDIAKTQVGAMLDAFLETVVDEVAKGESVRLIGFGTFGLTERAPRTGRNPQTGTVIKIPGCKAPKFTAGASFKEASSKRLHRSHRTRRRSRTISIRNCDRFSVTIDLVSP